MKLLVWGTGKCAKELMDAHENRYLRLHSIVAFVDNNPSKWGQTCFNRKVISPQEIGSISYDKILVCSRLYEQEILFQLQKEYKVERSYLMTLDELEDDYYEELFRRKCLHKLRGILVGDEDVCKMWMQYLCAIGWNIGGWVDVRHLKSLQEFEFDYVMLMRVYNIPSLDFDWGGGKVALEKHVMRQIAEECGIDENIIYTDSEIYFQFSKNAVMSFGERNDDKIFLWICLRSPLMGLGSMALYVVNNLIYAREQGFIPVVDMTAPNQYLRQDEVGVVNAWEKFFEQPAGVGIQELMESKHVILTRKFNSYQIKYDTISSLEEQGQLRKMCLTFERSLFQESLKGKKVLGVLFRGSDYANLRPYGHSIQPDLETMIQFVKKHYEEVGSYEGIYLCTEVEEAVVRFKEVFHEKLYSYPQERVPKDYSGYLANFVFSSVDTYFHRGADYWAAIKVLSSCTSLIAGQCNGTKVAIALNNNQYEYQYVFDLGVYGLDDQ